MSLDAAHGMTENFCRITECSQCKLKIEVGSNGVTNVGSILCFSKLRKCEFPTNPKSFLKFLKKKSETAKSIFCWFHFIFSVRFRLNLGFLTKKVRGKYAVQKKISIHFICSLIIKYIKWG